MSGPSTIPRAQSAAPGSSAPLNTNRLEGRLFGALVLAAFVLYGVGSAQAEHAVGVTLVALNSLGVTILGVIGYRLLRAQDHRVASGYVVARAVEAVALVGGVGIAAVSTSTIDDPATTGYLIGMIALGIGSVPFCNALGHGGWLPRWMARWGAAGYTALATGAAIDLVTGQSVTVLFAIPGGLFELALGLYLLRRGFSR